MLERDNRVPKIAKDKKKGKKGAGRENKKRQREVEREQIVDGKHQPPYYFFSPFPP